MVLPKIKAQHLPKGWVPTTIGDILEFEYGKGLPKKDRNEDGEYPVYGSNGIVGYHDNFLIESPALIIGRKGAAGEVSFSEKNCWPIDTTYFIRNFKLLSINFVYYLLKTVKLTQLDKSTAIPGLNRNDAYRVKINIPPLPEQHRIVAKIEELFSQLDSGISSLKKAQAQLKIYRQAVLKYAFEGKLTEEWRKQHQPDPAEKLLEQIRLERERHHQQQLEEWKAACEQANAEGKKKPTKPRKPKELPPLTEDELGELPALPEGWCWTKLGKITDIVGGVTKGRKLDDKKTVKLPYLRVANVQDGYLDLKEIKHIRVLDSDLKKYRLVYGDILFTEGGDKDKLGRGSVWKGEIKNCIHQNHIFRARTINNDVMLAKYISYSCQTQTAKKYYFDHAKQTVNLASINMTVLSNTPIPITNSSEQHAIVQEIESRLSVCDKLEQTIETNLRKSDALRQSILKKAFEGKLVPQNPDDEPAEKLLERIQLEKAELDAKTKAAKAKKKKKRL